MKLIVRSRSRRVVGALTPLAALGVAMLTAWLALGGGSISPMRLAPITRTPLSSADSQADPPPTVLLKLDPAEAERRNDLLPYSDLPPSQGASFRAAPDDVASLNCLTQAIYYEAGSEPEEGKRAVAQVVINRLSSSPFPKTVCGVVRQGAGQPGCQFTFMCDGSLGRPPSSAGWTDAARIASEALNGFVDPVVGAATHYHADYVFPVWAPTLVKLVKVGRHIFYRWSGARPAAPPPPPDTITPLASAASDAAGMTGAGAVADLNPAPASSQDDAAPSAPPALQPPESGSAKPSAAPSPTLTSSGPVPLSGSTAPSPHAAPSPRRAVPDASLRGGVG